MNRVYQYSLTLLCMWTIACLATRSKSAFSFVTTNYLNSSSSYSYKHSSPSVSSLFFHERCRWRHRSSFAMSEKTETETEAEMEVYIGGNLQHVISRVELSCKEAGRSADDVRLVAVSKTKPLSFIKEAYANGQRIFGENYAQELEDKAKDIGESDIQWHFIGGLQSNKAAKLVKNVLPYGKLVVETVASEKVANKLDNAMTNFDGTVLDVFVQVNTSGEETKSGVNLDESVTLCKHIVDNCKRLKFKGVMTIGAPGDEDCLNCLVKCRQLVADAICVNPIDIELSMGMSGDFENAIAKGSTNVRVGSTIFGQRDYSK